MKQQAEFLDCNRDEVESTTFPELQEKLISLINQIILDWNTGHPGYFAELFVHSEFGMKFEKKARFAERRKLIITIFKNNELFIPHSHMKVCTQLMDLIKTSVVSQYFHAPQNHKYIVKASKQKIGVTFDLYPKGYIDFNNQK